MRVGLDTNVLAYAEGVGDQRRCEAARDLIARLPAHLVVIPAQTLGELQRVLVGKAARAPAQAREAVLGWADAFDVADSSFEALRSALDLTVDHQMPIWDALIMSVAADQKCRLLLSEDFQPGFTWRGMTVVNPFLPSQDPLLAAVLT